ncbi:MAG: hypothetical protein LAO23_21125 [Acidobacteriia bacterium]|nr:hypothetical protein [Terriglobia bacterium]
METRTDSFVMWGERGLVASLFLDLYGSGNHAAWASFLLACGFDAALPWLKSPICSTSTIVEPDFSNEGFGHPDAISKFGFESHDPIVLIVEAKRLPFDRCCVSPATRGGAGYNSSLNGQLELNHCLALALSEYANGDSILSEPAWVLHSPYAIERRGRLRSLKNRVVIDEVAKPFSGLPFRSYYHLLITTDESNPLDKPSNEPAWPELYHPDYPFQNCWKDLRSQYGWISWDAVANLVRKLSADRKVEESLFLTTFEPNRRNFKCVSAMISEEAPIAPDEPVCSPVEDMSTNPVPSFIKLPSGSVKLPGGSGRGATMIYAPNINPNTFIHFSWLNESCAIRDYSKSPTIMPFENRNYRTSDVRRSITKEVVIRNRKPISDTRYWYETTMNLNTSGLSRSSGNDNLSNESTAGR